MSTTSSTTALHGVEAGNESGRQPISANVVGSAEGKKNVSSSGSESGTRWTFLTNHTHVLFVLHSDPDIVLREVATQVGITERAVQRIIVDLEESGFIRRERVGRRNRYSVLTDQPLRHPLEAHRDIGDLLNLISREDSSASQDAS